MLADRFLFMMVNSNRAATALLWRSEDSGKPLCVQQGHAQHFRSNLWEQGQRSIRMKADKLAIGYVDAAPFKKQSPAMSLMNMKNKWSTQPSMREEFLQYLLPICIGVTHLTIFYQYYLTTFIPSMAVFC
jgi:hypothetical protein